MIILNLCKLVIRETVVIELHIQYNTKQSDLPALFFIGLIRINNLRALPGKIVFLYTDFLNPCTDFRRQEHKRFM